VKIFCRTIPAVSLDQPTRSAMWQLFSQNYTGINFEAFTADLLAKDRVILLYRDDQLTGFTSLGSLEFDRQRVVYSGDVIIEASSRNIGTAHFFHQWALAVWQKYDWWCLLTSGPRTYRIAHTFYKRVTPDEQETEKERNLRNRFASGIYGDQYDAATGIVKLQHAYVMQDQACRQREGYPLAKTFERLNPGWHKGDELVSLISLHPDNWKPVALRMLHWEVSNG
jgi:hypothetical protein